MKTIFLESYGMPMKITIDDKTLARINYWMEFLSKVKILEHERVSCSMGYGTEKFSKDEKGINYIVQSADGPVLEIDRYSEDKNIQFKDTMCYIEIYPGRAIIMMVGNEGPEYPLDEVEIQDIPDLYFSEGFIIYCLKPLFREFGRYFRWIKDYHMSDEQKDEFSLRCAEYKAARKK